MLKIFEDLPKVTDEELLRKYGGYPRVALVVYPDVLSNDMHLYAIGNEQEIAQIKQQLLEAKKSGQFNYADALTLPLFGTPVECWEV